jgi:putative transcriptional regulator
MENHVRSMRTALGLRQEDLAEKLGVSRQTIISIENGRYNPSLLLAHQLAEAFGVTIERLFVFDEEVSR